MNKRNGERTMEMDNRSVRLNKKSNLLKLDEYMYPLVDTDKPNVFRNLFPYEEVPKIAFNDRIVPHEMPEDIWITDTTFVMDSSQEHRILQIRLYIFTMHFIV